MLFLVHATLRPEHAPADFSAKSHRWWNEGGRPSNLHFRSLIGAVGTGANVMLVEASDIDDLRSLVSFWTEYEFDIRPAVDLGEVFRQQSMDVQ